MANYTSLKGVNASFSDMMKRFGVVTVMNAEVYNSSDIFTEDKVYTPDDVITAATEDKKLCTLDTLKVANLSVEGPSKTVTGGQYSNPLIKFGKSARLEMQDALGNAKAIEALCGGIVEYSKGSKHNSDNSIAALHYGEDFTGPKTIIGKSFFIDQKSGAQVPVKIIFYQFLPDSLFNLTQDAEGDATVFDMNGDLLTTEILVGDKDTNQIVHGVFYSIIPETEDIKYFNVSGGNEGTPALTLTAVSGYKVNGQASVDIPKDEAVRVKVTRESDSVVVFDEVIKNY